MRTVIFKLSENNHREFLCHCTIDPEKELVFIVSITESNSTTLPVDTSKPEEKSKSELTYPPYKILIVDDSSLQQKVMSIILKRLGFNADIAHNGKEAVQAMEKQSYDIIFMDICMPEMNGWQATKEIKRKRTENAPFIVAATSNTEPDDKVRCLEAGMDSFIPKPVNLDEVKAVLQAATFVKSTTSPKEEGRPLKRVYVG